MKTQNIKISESDNIVEEPVIFLQTTLKTGLHFLAQIICFFFFARFCSSTSNRPLKHLFSTFSAPSKDAVSTKPKNIVAQLVLRIVFILLHKNPQIMPRPPTMQPVMFSANGISPLANIQKL